MPRRRNAPLALLYLLPLFFALTPPTEAQFLAPETFPTPPRNSEPHLSLHASETHDGHGQGRFGFRSPSEESHPETPLPIARPLALPEQAPATLNAPSPPPAPSWEQLGIALPPPVADEDYYDQGRPDPELVRLGRLLFFDKELSGNRNISCATCHHPLAGTGDDLSLSVGEGASGLGRDRDLGTGKNAVVERVPRNAPPLFNLGAHEFTHLFYDGRVEPRRNGFRSPVGDQLPPGLDNSLAVQAMLPVTSNTEMAGQKGENPVATAAAVRHFDGPGGVWDLLARRLQSNETYVQLFRRAFPRSIRSSRDITFVHAANALAAYQGSAFRSDESPFDRYLRGDDSALDESALSGLDLFYGKAGCADCHSGKFQTDHQFHAIAVPQIGPGKGDGFQKHDDFGREQVTRKASDRYRFRTPSLRNVTVTGPWGHSGAYTSLEGIIRHHTDPVQGLETYDPSQLVLPHRPDLDAVDLTILDHGHSRAALAGANELEPRPLSDLEIEDLLAFLSSLTDPRAQNLESEIPAAVPSGLPVSDYVRFPEPQGRHEPKPSSHSPSPDLTRYIPREPGWHPNSASQAYDEIVRFLPHDARHRNCESIEKGRAIVDLISPFLQMALEPRH